LFSITWLDFAGLRSKILKDI